MAVKSSKPQFDDCQITFTLLQLYHVLIRLFHEKIGINS